jgi:hypothetical protein
MREIFATLERNFGLFFGIGLAWVVTWAAYSAWRRYKKGPIHPPFSEADVRFVERYASGFSHKSFFTRFGGAKNALVVRVLKDAVLIEPLAIFKWIMPFGFNDLEHYVAKSSIVRVQPSSSFGRQTMLLEFRANDGAQHILELALRKPHEFQAALKG